MMLSARAQTAIASPFMPSRRLDDRIRDLSANVARAANGDVEGILQELLAAIHEKLERLRARAATRFLTGECLEERRAIVPDRYLRTPQ